MYWKGRLPPPDFKMGDQFTNAQQVDVTPYSSTDTEPTTLNVLKALWTHNKYTRNSETLANLDDQEIEQFKWSQDVLHRDQEENNFVAKGFTSALALPQGAVQSIINGHMFPDLSRWFYATAAGKGIGLVGMAAGYSLGGPLGALAGKYLTEYATSGYVWNRSATEREQKVFEESGMEYIMPTRWQTLKNVIKEAPAGHVAGGILGGGLILGRRALKRKKAGEAAGGEAGAAPGEGPGGGGQPTPAPPHAPMDPSISAYMTATMSNSYSGNADPANVKSKTLLNSETMADQNTRTGLNQASAEYYGGPRFNMQDLVWQGLWGMARGEGISFDPSKSIKSIEEVTKAVLNGHRKILDGLGATDKIKYMFGTLSSIGDFSDSLLNIYMNDFLLNDLVDERGRPMSPQAIGEVSRTFMADKAAQLDFIKYVLGESTSITDYHPLMIQLAVNTKKMFNQIVLKWHELGVPIQMMENYLPQKSNPELIHRVGKEQFIRDLMDVVNHEKMGNATPAEIQASMEAIYNSFVLQDTMSYLTFTGTGKGDTLPLEKRVIHFKNAESYMKYMAKYGEFDNIFDAIRSHARSSSRAQGIVNQLGPHSQDVFVELMKGINPHEISKEGGMAEYFMYTQMYNRLLSAGSGLFSAGDNFFIGQDFGMPSIMRALIAANSIGKNVLTKNNMLYELFETPLNLAFFNQLYGVNKDSLRELTSNWNGLIGEMKQMLFGVGGLTAEQHDALKKLGMYYASGLDIFPYSLSTGDAYSAPLGARKINHWINKIKMTDDLQKFNKIRASHFHQMSMAEWAKKKWGDLEERQRGLLASVGIKEYEWDLVNEYRDLIVIDGGNLANIFGITPTNDNIDAVSGMAKVKIEYLSHTPLLKSSDPRLRAIGYKLAALQADSVARVNTESKTMSTMFALGKNSYSNTIPALLARGLFTFRGYAIDRVVRSLTKLDLEGHSASGSRFSAFMLERLLVGMIVGSIRWAAAGREIQLDSLEDWLGFISDCLSRGDAFPFSILTELFADHYHTQGNNVVANAKAIAGKIGAPGLTYLYNSLTDSYSMVKGLAGGDNEAAFKAMRRLNPLGTWLPTDFAINRLILDPLFHSIDPDAAYATFKREIENNNKQHYRNFIQPGAFTGRDYAGDIIESKEQYKAIRDISKAKKEGQEHPLAATRIEYKKKAQKLKNAAQKDPENTQLMNELAKLHAEYNLQVAVHYSKNRPKDISRIQVENNLRRAISNYEKTLQAFRKTKGTGD